MGKIYLINVGANTQHAGKARSPLFDDDTFEFVTFEKRTCKSKYPKHLHRFVRKPKHYRTHLDPDWEHLTYGDHCKNGRAGALREAKRDDWLLFWALLWKVPDRKADVLKASKDARRWCLIGVMRVRYPLEAGSAINRLPKSVQKRVKHNEHVCNGEVVKKPKLKTRVFVGNKSSSSLFSKPVDLGIGGSGSLLQKVVFSAEGKKLQWSRSPKWNSSTRACRAIFDSSKGSPRCKSRLKRLEREIKKQNPRFRGFQFWEL